MYIAKINLIHLNYRTEYKKSCLVTQAYIFTNSYFIIYKFIFNIFLQSNIGTNSTRIIVTKYVIRSESNRSRKYYNIFVLTPKNVV